MMLEALVGHLPKKYQTFRQVNIICQVYSYILGNTR